MSKNDDALRCAENHQKIARMNGGIRSVFISQKSLLDSSEHIRRLVAENEQKESALKIVEATCDDFANQIEAKDALLRQAVEALENGSPDQYPEGAGLYYDAISAIRQHLEGRA